MSEDKVIQFENTIRKAFSEFNQRIEQQRSFQIQNILLKKLHERLKEVEYCHYPKIKDLSLEYEDFYKKLRESGRSYENIVQEKNLVDTYSAFEKFLFDCFCSIYSFFPKYLGEQKPINISDLFIDGNVELCKRNVIESEVKNFIQNNNILEIIDGLNKKFSIKTIFIPDNYKNILYEISLIRNLLIHSNGIVNRVYIEQIKKILRDNVKYKFNVGDTVLNKLEALVQDIKDIATKICEKITDAIVSDSKRLEKHHESKI